MNLRPVSTLALASTVALLAVDRAPAAVLCVSRMASCGFARSASAERRRRCCDARRTGAAGPPRRDSHRAASALSLAIRPGRMRLLDAGETLATFGFAPGAS